MKRFCKSNPDAYGNIYIYDELNTEPVCMIFAGWHQDKINVILNSLEETFGDVQMDKCECGNEKAVEWLHCGCQIEIGVQDGN